MAKADNTAEPPPLDEDHDASLPPVFPVEEEADGERPSAREDRSWGVRRNDLGVTAVAAAAAAAVAGEAAAVATAAVAAGLAPSSVRLAAVGKGVEAEEAEELDSPPEL